MDSTKKTDKKLKKGFTTGSVATLAAKAAVYMLLTGEIIDEDYIILPGGEKYASKIFAPYVDENKKQASCFVKKPESDDPDVTAGIKIYATVSLTQADNSDELQEKTKYNRNTDFTDMASAKIEENIEITGGEGIGIVTRPGLNQKISEYAINETPRKMIKQAVSEVMDELGFYGRLKVEISAPEGIEIAKKTFNPHMGIEGGISIIGTTGIVEPMSTKALTDTILLDLKMHYEENNKRCIIVPGNYGVTFLKNSYGISEKEIVLCSNYVGESIKMAVDTGFKNIIFCSHIGKLIKVYGGIMNTHSMYGDHRMELMKTAFLKIMGGNTEYLDTSEEIMNCVSTTAVLDLLFNSQNGKQIVNDISNEIVRESLNNLYKAAKMSEKFDDDILIKCIMYENSYGELSNSDFI